MCLVSWIVLHRITSSLCWKVYLFETLYEHLMSALVGVYMLVFIMILYFLCQYMSWEILVVDQVSSWNRIIYIYNSYHHSFLQDHRGVFQLKTLRYFYKTSGQTRCGSNTSFIQTLFKYFNLSSYGRYIKQGYNYQSRLAHGMNLITSNAKIPTPMG